MKSKKILSIIMIILMVIFVAGCSYAAPLDLNSSDEVEDLTPTLDQNANNNSSTNDNSSLTPNANANTNTNNNGNRVANGNTDNTMIGSSLPATGAKMFIIPAIILIILAYVYYNRYMKYKDI